MKTEQIVCGGRIFATIFYNGPFDPGVHFYTNDTAVLQVGKQLRPKGTHTKPHRHCSVKVDRLEVFQEVLYIKQGKMNITFYDDNNKPFTVKILCSGDMILLVQGGHGFEFLEETEMIEIKQGPYNPQATQRLESVE